MDMEATGIGEAAQVVSIGIEGIDKALRLTGSLINWSILSLSQLTKFILGTIEKQKEKLSPGETRLDRLLKYNATYGEQTMVMQIDESIREQFVTYCKDNNLTYSFLFDVNKEDDCVEVCYPESQQEVFGVFMRRYPEHARAYSFEEYLDNATPERVMEMDETLSKETVQAIHQNYQSSQMVPFWDLAENNAGMAAITMDDAQYSVFSQMADKKEINYTVLQEASGIHSVLITEPDYRKTRSFLKENHLEKQSFAEFLCEHWNLIPDADMITAAKEGTGIRPAENQRYLPIDMRQIAEVNEFAVKVRIRYREEDAYINIPRENLIYNGKHNALRAFFPAEEQYHVVKESAFTTKNEKGELVMVPQVPVASVGGKEIGIAVQELQQELISQEAVLEEQKTLADKFVNVPYDKVEEPLDILKFYTPEAYQANQEKNPAVTKEPESVSKQSDSYKTKEMDRAAQYGVIAHPEAKESVGVGEKTTSQSRDITIDESLIRAEDEQTITTRVPWSEGSLSITFPKKDVVVINGGKTLLTKLDMNREYDVYDRNMEGIRKMSGAELYKDHYDPAWFERRRSSMQKTRKPRTTRTTRTARPAQRRGR